MKRIVEWAGLVPWPMTFINLRSTRRTELQEVFPSHVVDEWLGHSTKTAETHYLQVTDEHWRAAANPLRDATSESGGVIGGASIARQDDSGDGFEAQEARKMRASDASWQTMKNSQMTPTGLEPVSPP